MILPVQNTKKSVLNPLTKNLLICIFLLMAFGLVMIYDATSIYSQNIYGNAHKFVFLQVGWIVLGSVFFYLFYNLDYRKLKVFAFFIFLSSLVFLILLALMGMLPCNANIPFSPCVNGANRWLFLNPSPLPKIPFLGVLGFQPAELAKLALILYLSFQLSLKAKKEDAFWVYIIITGLFSGLVLLQPNMSTAVMLGAIGSIMYFVSGFPLKPLLILFPILLLTALLLMFSSSYRRDRVLTFMGGANNDELSEGYHTKQISISLGSGGFFGLGFGQSRQKYQYLPEVATDSLFAIIGEELGFVGTTFVICLFSYFLYLGFSVARGATDLLGKLLATGITSWIGLQFFVNGAAMAKIIPLTGVPMPLISYGGSSMIFSLMALGVLLNISRHSK